MAVTSHIYPKAMLAIFDKTIDLHADTFKAVLFTGDASAWTATQEAYQYLSDLKTAYTECADADYARVTLTSPAVSNSGAKTIWSCATPISFGSAVTITARSMAIVDTSIGAGVDSATPVVAIIDFGQNYASTAEPWEFDVDGVNGLGYVTSS